MSDSLLLAVHDLTVIYNGEPALDHVSFEMNQGDRMAVIGPNGAGKSTLLKAIMGLIQPQDGHIHLAGTVTRLGYVPQHDDVDWAFPVTVLDVVLMGAWREIRWLRMAGKSQRARAMDSLERVGMAAFAKRQVGELSGGQRRRVFIARALATQADTLLLDEPFSGIDVSAEAELLNALLRLNEDGISLILSTHDLEQARAHFDTVLALRRRVIAFGSPVDVFTPANLAGLYGKQMIAYEGGQPVTVFVDEHGCDEC